LGDNLNDLGMLQAADRGFVIDPKSPLLSQTPGLTVVNSFDDLLAHVPEPLAAAAA
jgi:phosphoserine phosphatase